MKIEHIDSEVANKARRSVNHIVFHVDERLGYALVKIPGSSYYNRGANYVSGRVDFVWLRRLSEGHGKSVWDLERGRDGLLTPKRAKELIARIDAVVSRLCTVKQFEEACERNIGARISVEQTIIGAVASLGDHHCVFDWLRWSDNVKKIYDHGKYSDWILEATSPEHEAEKERLAKEAKEQAKIARAKAWQDEFEASDKETQLKMITELVEAAFGK